ncbi:hypothetical protein KY334_06900 [Candidatus Woesearchaeota archaeon]|nr:hypothetical protein [Candidatus Woesearchaeota archaeon]
MKLMDILRKLGIIRSGVKSAKYKNAKERPLEIQQSDIYNAKKDLINKKK